MYEIDGSDNLVDLHDVPQSDVGAPLPVLVADGHNVCIGYILAERDPNWDGTYATMVGPTSEDEPIAIIRFRNPRAHFFGPPNDEAFSGHPLSKRGLQPYSAVEVRSSSWIRKLERMNAVHPQHLPAHFARYRHFIFAFHDSTFECVAEGFDVTLVRSSIRDTLAHMAELICKQAG